MPYDKPSDGALSAAYDKIADSADASPAAAINPADALTRADQVLWLGTNRLSAKLQENVQGPWGEGLFVLRDLAVEYAGQVVAALRTAISSDAMLGVVMPTRDRLAGMIADYEHGHHGAVHIEEYGEDDDQTLIEQFAIPVVKRGTQFPGGSRSQEEFVRAAFGVIGAAAALIAAVEERPPLHPRTDR